MHKRRLHLQQLASDQSVDTMECKPGGGGGIFQTRVYGFDGQTRVPGFDYVSPAGGR